MRSTHRLFASGLVLCLLVIAGALRAQRAPITVPAGGDLQAALDRARPGDVILLAAGATYVGNFVLPVTSGSSYITIRSNADPGNFPDGRRVTPDQAKLMPIIRSPNGSPALATAPGAHHWRLQWLMFEANQGGFNDIITLGDGSAEQRTLSSVPHHLVLDGLIIRGHPADGQKRAIALNSGDTVIRNSDIRGIKAVGQDSQAICGWNGPGPYVIENNYLEAAGENVMFGGADPAIPNLVPSDIVFRRNYVTKPLEWRDSDWTVKNLFELKNAQRVLIEWNVFEHSWSAAQTGYAILFTPMNQDGAAPWTVVADVTFQHNLVRRSAAGINILGQDYQAPSRETRRITIRENLFAEIDAERWGGDGRFLQIGDGPSDLVVDHNTVLQSGTFLLVYGKKDGRPRMVQNARLTSNLGLHNEYGILGEEFAPGAPSIAAYLPGAEVKGNALGGGDERLYPPGNLFPSRDALLAEFVNVKAADYRLRPGSVLRTAGVGGSHIGANVEALLRGLPRGDSPAGTTRPR